MEKNIKKKECLCVYIKLNHFAVQQKLTQHYKLTILPKKKKKALESCKSSLDRLMFWGLEGDLI